MSDHPGERRAPSAKLEMAAALLAGSLHELRNLLAVASSSAYLAKGKLADPEALSKQLDKLDRQIQSARDLVERMVAVANGGRLETEEVALSDLVESALRDVGRPTSISLTVSIPADLVVRAERRLMERVVANLVENAIAALSRREEGGRIELRASATPSGVEMLVSDDGPGFGPVEPFAAVSSKPGGLGLGLFVVRALVEAHGGSVRVESSAQGVRATVALRT